MTDYDIVPTEEVELEVSRPSIDTSGMSHSEKIKMACSATGVTYSEPRNGCKKCSGKGYVGVRQGPMINDPENPNVQIRGEGKPIICPCVLRDNSDEYKEQAREQVDGQYKLNRKQRRQQQKLLNKLRRRG